ncbi:hypothetical protein VNI00_012106 [Paramarasmius palmivorus]|uniref:SH3 domain-containing protein n=1 Tax=Paramarasmius palmivorus TaxID=297713 RepID=A0AAW0C5W5_9AGAR
MSDTSAQRRAQQVVERRRPAARGFEYRKRAPQVVDADDITLSGGQPITGAITLTVTRTLATGTRTSASRTSTTSTTSSTSSESRTSISTSQGATSSETTEKPTLEPSASPFPPATISGAGSNAVESSPSVESTTSLGSTKLSGGAIAGIAIAVVVILAAIIVFLFRKRMIANRKDRRNNWSGGVSPPQPAMTTVPLNTPAIQAFRDASGYGPPSEPAPPVPPIPASLLPGGVRPGSVAIPPPPQAQPPVVVPPPPSSFNPPIVGGTIVRCTFIPNLDDELWITTGETIKVLQEYDDGWALCENAGQQRGMVPVECLERGGGGAQDAKPDLKRSSSLSNRSK